MTTNIERELGKLESKIDNLDKRQDKVEQDFKSEVNTLKNDIKDLKRELQGDFKDLKKSVDDISLGINELKNFDSNQVAGWKTVTIMATITTTLISFVYAIYQHFK